MTPPVVRWTVAIEPAPFRKHGVGRARRSTVMRAFALALCVITSALGQKLTLGVVAGSSLTGDFRTGSSTFPGGILPDGQRASSTVIFSPVPRSFIIGPRLELRLPWNWSLEVDALHREFRAKSTFISFVNGTTISSSGPFTGTRASWEFPVLAKHRFPGSRLSPFLEAGPSFRPAASGAGLTHLGITAGAGVETHLDSLSISPTVRYTRWSRWRGRAGVGAAVLDQVEALVAIEYATTAPGWTSAFGRRFSVGVLAGVGLGDDLKTVQDSPLSFRLPELSESNSPIFGVLFEFEVRRHLFVELNGIYRPLHGTRRSVRFAVLTWEFPALAKYKFRTDRPVRPFLELGPSFRTDGNFNGPTPSHYGITGGAGVEARFSRLKISPAVRYTHWAKERSPRSPFRTGTFLTQVECLAGFSF